MAEQRNGRRQQRQNRKQAEALIERAAPYDLDAEQGLLGSILLMPSVWEEVSAIVRGFDFYDDANRGIFLHMADLKAKGRPIDMHLLVSSLKDGGDWEAIGGAAYIKQVFESVPNAAHAIYYAGVIAEHGVRRRIIEECTVLLRDAYDRADAKELLKRGEEAFRKIASHSHTGEEGLLLGEWADQVVTQIENPEVYSTLNRAHFGLQTLDERVGPIMPGEILVMAARPGGGKTAFAMQVCRHSAERQRPALYVSLEMGGRELAIRDLGRRTEIDSRAVRRGELEPGQRFKMRAAQQEIGDLPLEIWAPHTASVGDVINYVRRAVKKRGIRLVAIDYLSLLAHGSEGGRFVSREQQVSADCRAIKRLAREVEIPIIVLQQLNRDAEECEPSMRHLRESGAIEQDADIIMFLHHGKRHKKSPIDHWNRQLIVAKFRAGGAGDMLLGWDGKRTLLTDLSEAKEPEAEAPQGEQQTTAF